MEELQPVHFFHTLSESFHRKEARVIALGIAEINEKLVESQARIDALVPERAAVPFAPA